MTNYTSDFKAFWKAFPGRYHESGRQINGGCEYYWKIGKRQAFLEWKKLSDYDKKWAMYAVKSMRKGKYVPDAHRWLRDGKYEDIDMPDVGERLPKDMTNSLKIVKFDEVSTSDKVNKQREKLGL